MPLLLRGLDLHDYEIRAGVIDTLLAAAEGGSSSKEKESSILAEHASSLVSMMLKNSMIKDMPSVVRMGYVHLCALPLISNRAARKDIRFAVPCSPSECFAIRCAASAEGGSTSRACEGIGRSEEGSSERSCGSAVSTACCVWPFY